MGSENRKSRDLGWETADQWEKWIVGSGNRESRDLEWETADQLEKMDCGLRLRKERTFHDADMTCPLARVGNR